MEKLRNVQIMSEETTQRGFSKFKTKTCHTDKGINNSENGYDRCKFKTFT